MSGFYARLTTLFLAFLVTCCGSDEQASGALISTENTTLTVGYDADNHGYVEILNLAAGRAELKVECHEILPLEFTWYLDNPDQCPFDMLWPASSVRVLLAKTPDQSIATSFAPIERRVVFALRGDLAKTLKVTGKMLSLADIAELIKNDGVKLAMPSASQCDAGALAYLGMLASYAKQGQISQNLLQDAAAKSYLQQFLQQVDVTSAGVKELLETANSNPEGFNAFFGYDDAVMELNARPESTPASSYEIYIPTDVDLIAAAPMILTKRAEAKLTSFDRLKGEMPTITVEKQEGAESSTLTLPPSPLLWAALTLYQTELRRPSATAYVLDYSSSMKGDGEKQLEEAMTLLLDPVQSAYFLMQPSPGDVTTVIPFNGGIIAEWSVTGNNPEELRGLLKRITDLAADGNTNIYKPAAKATKLLDPFLESTVQIVLMSDGESSDSIETFEEERRRFNCDRRIPIVTILFGNAAASQMRTLAERTNGLMLDARSGTRVGRSNLVSAMQKARSFN